MTIIVAMNLAAIDLNLLVAFEALMEERHVTRAGQRIGLAQPSMSSALARLRALFDDDLLVRTAEGMQPTARALALARPVSEALEQIRRTLDSGRGFDPGSARRHFTIAVTDYGDLVIVPALVEALRRDAPGVDLTVRPITDAIESLARLERGEVDALIGGHLPVSSRTTRQFLLMERFTCVRDASRAAPGISLDRADFVRLPHVLFSSMGGDGSPSAVDAILSEHGHKRRVAVTLPHVVAVPFVLAGTDLVATMAERIALRIADVAGVAILPLPYEVPAFAIDLVHGLRATSNPAMQWFVDLIVKTCRTI
ncbi:LysR family transcriptional regulator [Bosea sp. 2RAB26]|uniref:LysR family transcriptional regulator n=1 Tax=Bosea sp. 2RAB26 TaxID=3237476 RepID=UPI003F93D295